MGTSLKIMDLELDLLTEETFCKKMAKYLSGDLFRVVHLVSLDYIDKYEEEPVVQEVLEEADLVLPGEKAILSLYHVDVLETGGMVVDYRIAHRLLKKDLLKGKKCFLVLRSKKEAKIVYRYLKSAYENLDIVGVYSMDTGVTEEALVNEINTKVPDLILMAMENHEAESFLKHKRHMINAKMGVVLSGVMDMILRENIHVPNVIKKLHLGKIYTSAARIPYSVRWRRRIFRKKMDNYNTKKQLEQSDAQKELSEDEKHDQ